MEHLTHEVESIRRMARALLGCSHAADDAVQDAWIAANGSRSGSAEFDRPRSAAWLRGVVRNVVRRQLRLRRQEEDARARRSDELDGDEPPPLDSTLESVETAEMTARLTAAVRDLPEAYQAVLVRRYWHREDYAAIASALGTTRKAVLNRHFRALEALRARFDSRRGGLESLALLPLVPSAQKTTASALAPTLTAMKASTILSAAVLASLALTALAFRTRDAGPVALLESSAAEAEAQASSISQARESVVAEAGPDLLAAPKAQADGDRQAAPAPTAPPALAASSGLRPALVRWTAIDAETRETIKRVEVRGATDTRFVERKIKSGSKLALTPGRWTLAIRAVPYEVLELDPLVLGEGQTLNLGEIELTRGSGSIVGAVDVPAAVAATGPFRVELYGEGRSPCGGLASIMNDDSSEYCPLCGHGEERSVLVVAAGEHFRFDRLSAGSYRAVIFDAAGRLRFQTDAEITAGMTARLDLRMEFQDVCFQVVNGNDAPFDGKWTEEGTRYRGPLEFYFSSDSSPCASARTKAESATVFDATSGERRERTDYVYLRDPMLIQRQEQARVSVSSVLRSMDMRPAFAPDEAVVRQILTQVRGRAEAPAPPREPDDHVRAPEEAPGFVSTAPTPDIKTEPLRARREAPGRYRVLLVPEQADMVTLTCGPYFATISLDEPGPSGIYDVELVERCNAKPDLFIDSRNCVDCHPNTSMAGMQW